MSVTGVAKDSTAFIFRVMRPTIRHHILYDLNFQQHRCENLKCGIGAAVLKNILYFATTQQETGTSPGVYGPTYFGRHVSLFRRTSCLHLRSEKVETQRGSVIRRVGAHLTDF